jgi:hypothetical protein
VVMFAVTFGVTPAMTGGQEIWVWVEAVMLAVTAIGIGRGLDELSWCTASAVDQGG